MGEIRDLTPEQLLSFLEMEATFLDGLHGKISDELERLEREEAVFMRAVAKVKAAQLAEREEIDRELQEAMSTESQGGDEPPPPDDASEAAWEGRTPRRNRDPAAAQFALTGNLPEGHEIIPLHGDTSD